MKKQEKSILLLAAITVFVATALCLPGLIGAGDLEPSPEAVNELGRPVPTMVMLDDIYNALLVALEVGVEKTGQTTCYDESGTEISCSGTGQDGDLQKGVAWPNPRFSDNLDGTVTDNLTKLIWLKDANCFGLKTWSVALTECNELASGSCGLTDGSLAGDWRLPNVKELQSLIDYGRTIPALPSGGSDFDNVQSYLYWSSTTYVFNTSGVWCVHMGSGYEGSHSKASSYYVWPVRAGN